MKHFHKVLCLALMAVSTGYLATGQTQDKSKRPSPPDQVSQVVNGKTITIDYSQPSVKDRKIWGELVPFGKVWRTGANEASWIEVSEDVTINGKPLPKGKYGLFTLPGENEWTIIFNKTWNQWGAYEYDDQKDVLRVVTKPVSSSDFKEKFTIEISPEGVVTMAWEKLKIPFEIK